LKIELQEPAKNWGTYGIPTQRRVMVKAPKGLGGGKKNTQKGLQKRLDQHNTGRAGSPGKTKRKKARGRRKCRQASAKSIERGIRSSEAEKGSGKGGSAKRKRSQTQIFCRSAFKSSDLELATPAGNLGGKKKQGPGERAGRPRGERNKRKLFTDQKNTNVGKNGDAGKKSSGSLGDARVRGGMTKGGKGHENWSWMEPAGQGGGGGGGEKAFKEKQKTREKFEGKMRDTRSMGHRRITGGLGSGGGRVIRNLLPRGSKVKIEKKNRL